MGLRDSSKFNTAHQAGVRDPDRPSPTSITSFFDYHVISFIQALHERHLRHRPCPDNIDLYAHDCQNPRSRVSTRRPRPHAKYYSVRRLPQYSLDPFTTAGLKISSCASSTSASSGFTPCFALALSSTSSSFPEIFISTSTPLRPQPRHLPSTASPAVSAALPPRSSSCILNEEANFSVPMPRCGTH